MRGYGLADRPEILRRTGAEQPLGGRVDPAVGDGATFGPASVRATLTGVGVARRRR